jgi:hypothetical protein
MFYEEQIKTITLEIDNLLKENNEFVINCALKMHFYTMRKDPKMKEWYLKLFVKATGCKKPYIDYMINDFSPDFITKNLSKPKSGIDIMIDKAIIKDMEQKTSEPDNMINMLLFKKWLIEGEIKD